MSAFYQPLETPNKQTSLLWCKATAVWSPLAAGATAYWIQDCCACLPVSSWTSSGVSVFRATECEGPTIKATTTIVVVALPTRAYIATVNGWRSCFSSRCRTSLECSLSRYHLSQLSASFQTSAEDGALSTELSGSCSNCIWLIEH